MRVCGGGATDRWSGEGDTCAGVSAGLVVEGFDAASRNTDVWIERMGRCVTRMTKISCRM